MKIDIDALFDEFLSDFIDKNCGVLSAVEIEKQVSTLYDEFGDIPNETLGGLTPNEYFCQMNTEDLLDAFKEGIQEENSVSEYLCKALEKRVEVEDELLKMAFGDNEELAVYSVNVLSAMGREKSLKRFIEVLSESRLTSVLIDVVTEALCNNADLVKEELLRVYKPNAVGCESFEEVFSNMSKDERVFKILYANFLNDGKNLAINASYLAKYGDERALSVLYSTIKRQDISIIEYSEIKKAIEKLGGQVEDDGRFLKNAKTSILN